MTEFEAFEAGIADDPDNQLRRDVFSDWLLEHDEPEEAERQREYTAADRRLREMAEECQSRYDSISYARLMETAKRMVETDGKDGGVGLYNGQNDSGCPFDDDYAFTEEFWAKFAIVTGLKVPEKFIKDHEAPVYFTCAC